MLVQEGHQLCEDFVLYERVQIAESVKNNKALTWPPGIEGYIKQEFGFEVAYRLQIGGGKRRDYRAWFISCSPRGLSLDLDNPTANEWVVLIDGTTSRSKKRGSVVFVYVPDTLERSGGMNLRLLPSLVHLEVFDNAQESRGRIYEDMRRAEKLKESQPRSELDILLCPAPSEVIKRGAKVMDGVSNDEAQFRGDGLIPLHPVDLTMLFPFTFYYGDGFISHTVQEQTGLVAELVYMRNCMVNPFARNPYVSSHTTSTSSKPKQESTIGYTETQENQSSSKVASLTACYSS